MKISVCVSHISALKALMAVLAVFLVKAGFAVVLENEDKAYGELHSRIVERIRLWPGFAPHEKDSSPGRYAYDAKRKVPLQVSISRYEGYNAVMISHFPHVWCSILLRCLRALFLPPHFAKCGGRWIVRGMV